MSQPVPAASVDAQRDRILASEVFGRAERLSALLRFLIDRTRRQPDTPVKEYVLGVEVFGRSPAYDPRTDPIVRVEMRQLRLKLTAYYAGAGASDPIVIEVPKGQYQAVIRERPDPTPVPQVTSVALPDDLAPPVARVRSAAARRRWLAAAMLAIAALAGALRWGGYASLPALTSASVPPAPRAPSVAVLPFAELGGGEQTGGLGEGLADEIGSALARLDGVLVTLPRTIPSSSTRRDGALGLHLTTDALIDGSVRQIGDRLRVVARVTRVADGLQLWSATFDSAAGDRRDAGAEVTASVTHALEQRLDPTSAQPFVVRSNEDPEARAVYLRARRLAHTRDRAEMLAAADLFEQAIARDAGFAMAHAGLADAVGALAVNGQLAPGSGVNRSRAAASRALALDPTLGEALAQLAYLSAFVDWNWAEGERQFRRAIDLTPSHARIRAWFGQMLTTCGRFDEGIDALLAAQRLDPLSASLTYALGEAYLYSGRSEDALVQARQLLDANPRSWGGHNLLARASLQLGRRHDALEALQQSRGELWADTLALVARDDRAGARALLRARHREMIDMPFAIASLFASAGDTAESLAWLQRAYALRQIDLVSLAVDPAFEPARADPRFRALVAKVGL
jgi:eukaryotic-like serine/threonine-protein kinase